MTAIEQLFKRARGVKDEVHYFEEVIVTSHNLLHVFMRSKKYPEHAVVFVCRKSANLGMAIAKARIALPTIEAAV